MMEVTTGISNNIEKRFYEHQNGLIQNCYTHNKRPLECVFVEEFSEVNDAIAREKQIKGWSRKKKKALIDGDFERLITLSKSKSLPLTGLRQAQPDTSCQRNR